MHIVKDSTKQTAKTIVEVIAITALLLLGSQTTVGETTANNIPERITNNRLRAPGVNEAVVKTVRSKTDGARQIPRNRNESNEGADKGPITNDKNNKVSSDRLWIDYATVGFSLDYDGDGYYTQVNLDFDVDTDYLAIDVYALLFLSLEGGPWIEYAATDNFTVTTFGGDSYYVDTDLLEGFPPGYYDLLIEIYAADDDDWLTSYGPQDSVELSLLPLEDELADSDIIVEPGLVLTESSGGGGSVDIASLLAMLLLAGLGYRRHIRCERTRWQTKL